jgi:hypothetical protein
VFEVRVLRRIFGPERDGVTGDGENVVVGRILHSTCVVGLRLYPFGELEDQTVT